MRYNTGPPKKRNTRIDEERTVEKCKLKDFARGLFAYI